VEEAKRCLYCGPCMSCKACVVMELQPELPVVEVDEDLCCGCGVCISVCRYDATKLDKRDGRLISVIDDLKCKRCGLCVVACPSGARSINDGLVETVDAAIAAV